MPLSGELPARLPAEEEPPPPPLGPPSRTHEPPDGGGVRPAPTPRTAPPPAPRPCPCKRREEPELVPRPGAKQPLPFQPDEGCHGTGGCRCSSVLLLFPSYLGPCSLRRGVGVMPGSLGRPRGRGVPPVATSLGSVTSAAQSGAGRAGRAGTVKPVRDRGAAGAGRNLGAARPDRRAMGCAARPAPLQWRCAAHRITSPALHL